MDPQTQVLLNASADDETTMLLPALPPAHFGFHAQQAVEKLLKALIAQLGELYPWTHHANDLTKILIRMGEVLPATPLQLSEFDPFATVWRYNNPPPSVLLDPEKATATVCIIREFVHRRVHEIDSQSSKSQP
jgi:hypothetical protein